MVNLPILHGCCTIQLYRMVGGNKRYSHTIVWKVCNNTLVDECNFQRLNRHRWKVWYNPGNKSYYARRKDKLLNGKHVVVSMAREILGLPLGAGRGGDEADHEKHDTLDNTLDRLRVATHAQNSANRRSYRVRCRFKGTSPNGSGFDASICSNYQRVCFPTMRLEVEAALMYNYAAYLLHGEYAELSVIPEDEMPTYDRQWGLYDMVVAKLRDKGFPCVDALIRQDAA